MLACLCINELVFRLTLLTLSKRSRKLESRSLSIIVSIVLVFILYDITLLIASIFLIAGEASSGLAVLP